MANAGYNAPAPRLWHNDELSAFDLSNNPRVGANSVTPQYGRELQRLKTLLEEKKNKNGKAGKKTEETQYSLGSINRQQLKGMMYENARPANPIQSDRYYQKGTDLINRRQELLRLLSPEERYEWLNT